MISVFQKLLKNDNQEPIYFNKAKQFWIEFFTENRDLSVDELAKALKDVQSSYERIFEGNRNFAKETMALTCLGTLYDEVDGWQLENDLAIRVAKGFLKSHTSSEVKSYAKKAISLYSLDSYDEYLNKVCK